MNLVNSSRKMLLKSILCSTSIRQFTVTTSSKHRVCVVGAGAAGFYAAQHILKNLPNANIDIIEKYPVPFGLVRFGVAPDHPEVKNVEHTFTKIAQNERVSFIGNVSLGVDITLAELRQLYNAVILCYGAEQENKIGIEGEDENVLSARKIVAWYNGLPNSHTKDYAEIEKQLRSCSTLSIIGQGNVAIDVARILLSPIDSLRKTDITEAALSILSECNIKQVNLIGRRGPLQAAFTIKELREIIKMPNVDTIWRKEDFTGIDETLIGSLPRAKKRITELMWKNAVASPPNASSKKQFLPIFFRSPKSIETSTEKRLQLTVNEVTAAGSAVATSQTEMIKTDLIVRSIGYKGINVTNEGDFLNFDPRKGLVPNEQGRVLKSTIGNTQADDGKYERGLYVAGWLGTGPVGVILSTMNNAFLVANNVCKDIQQEQVDCSVKAGLNLQKFPQATSWHDWEKIDKHEVQLGLPKGKPREKILEVSKMLELVK